MPNELNIRKVVSCIESIIDLENNTTPSEENAIKKETEWKNSIQFLFLSVITGEYYLTACNSNLEKINNLLEKTSDGNFKQALNQYLFLNQYIDDRCEERFFNTIFNIDINKNIYPRYDTDYNFYWIFNVNIKLAVLDEGYNTSSEVINQLSRIHHDLTYAKENNILPGYDDIIVRLKHKCSLLLFKLVKRKQKNGQDNRVTYSIFNDSTFEDIQNQINEKKFIEKIESHYFNNDNVSFDDINAILKSNKTFDKNKVTVNNVHLFTKKVKNYLKQHEYSSIVINRNERTIIKDTINRIRKIIDDKKVLQNAQFISNSNKIVYDSLVNLLDNCEFNVEAHYILNKNINKPINNYNNIKTNFDSLKSKLEDCKKREPQKIENFILYKIYVEKLLLLLEKISNDKKELNNENYNYEDLIDQIFQQLYQNISFFKEKVLRAKKYNLMPIYLEIENCYNSENKIFSDSQYILPTDYEMLLDKYDELKDRIKNIETIKFYIIPQNIKKAFKEEFKKEVKEHQYNIITIIGLYAAFVTFILSSGNLLAKSPEFSMANILPSIIVIGCVLFYFIISIKILFSEPKALFTGWKLVWFILSLVIIIPCVFIVLIRSINF